MTTQQASDKALRDRLQEEEARRKRWAALDKTVRGADFSDYLDDRNMCLRATVFPHLWDPEAERSALGAMLESNAAVIECCTWLRPAHFYLESHRAIFLAMAKLMANLKPVDLTTTTNWLRRSGELESVGGAVHLAQLLNDCPSADNVMAYIEIILECSRMRSIASMAWRMGEAVNLPHMTPAALLAGVRAAVAAIETKGVADAAGIFSADELLKGDA